MNLGEINNHLLAFEKTLEDSNTDPSPAKAMLVVMVRGLFSKLQFAYAQFPCLNLNGYQLYSIFWEVVEQLERCGFAVLDVRVMDYLLIVGSSNFMVMRI